MPKTQDSTHTLTPWKAVRVDDGVLDTNRIVGPDGSDLHPVGHISKPEDAAFVVRAVNNHEALLAALADMLAYATSESDQTLISPGAISRARAAIEEALR